MRRNPNTEPVPTLRAFRQRLRRRAFGWWLLAWIITITQLSVVAFLAVTFPHALALWQETGRRVLLVSFWASLIMTIILGWIMLRVVLNILGELSIDLEETR